MKLGVTGEMFYVTLDIALGVYHHRTTSCNSEVCGTLPSEYCQRNVYITVGTVNGDIFLDFLYTQLLPILRPFDGRSINSVVVMDNASIYHVDAVIDSICSVGALVRFLPPYSPVFGEVKQYMQANDLLVDTSLSIPTSYATYGISVCIT